MKTLNHTTVSGHRIEVEASPKVAAFVARLANLVSNPSVSVQEMTGIAYSDENPILDHTLFPGRGAVTRAVLDDPAYAIVTDLLFRKQLAVDGTDVERIAAKYSMTVGEAAAELGIHESAVRQAIAAKRLASWLKDGRHYIDPRALKTLEVGTRGPTKKAAAASTSAPSGPVIFLEACMGNMKGASLSVRSAHPWTELERVTGNVKRARLEEWERVIVRTTGEGGTKRVWVLSHGEKENEITHGDFYVRGYFAIEAKSNNPKKADELWKTTAPA